MAVGLALAGCGQEDGSPLDTVRALHSAGPTGGDTTARPTDPPTAKPTRSRRPTRTPTAPATSGSSATSSPSATTTSRSTAEPATGATGPYINDPCKLLTPAEVASSTGLPVVKSEIDQDIKSSTSSFCDYRDADGRSLMTIMSTTRTKSYTSATEAAQGTIRDSDHPLPVAGIGDAAFTYKNDTANGIVWSKEMPGTLYLCEDVYVDRSDKDLPPDVLTALARTMIGKL
nr:DUF3558 family protein [Streptomyces sp. SID3343]